MTKQEIIDTLTEKSLKAKQSKEDFDAACRDASDFSDKNYFSQQAQRYRDISALCEEIIGMVKSL